MTGPKDKGIRGDAEEIWILKNEDAPEKPGTGRKK